MSWEETSLDDCIEFSNGYAFKSKFFTENKNDIPLIKGENLGKGEVLWEKSKYWKVESLKGLERFLLNVGDIILAMDRPYVGGSLKYAMIKTSDPKALQVQRIGRLVAKQSVINEKFLRCVISSDNFKNYVKNIQGGVGVPHISPSQIKNYEFNLPPLQTQKRIANILSGYDNLIENNLKRIKLLEQAAQNIYKEWFVNLRFPGHENAVINEESGLPEGWEEKGLCEFTSFKQYKTKIKAYEGEKEYLATANVDGIQISERGECFSFDKKPSRAQIAPPLNSVWFARMSNTDKVLCFTENTNNDLMISSGFAGFKAEKHEFLPFLFCTINNDVFSKLKDSYSTGSTQVSINNKSINSIRFIEPEIQIMKEFGNKLYPSLEMINKLFVTNKKIKAARDILLPRLMNRTIEV